ncbi:MAG: glycosyltransferase family 39 protein [Candidatus Nitrotoga sp.]|nr:glycosyltransferase family 39 protein [Candidatus Nitrotoga sp.]
MAIFLLMAGAIAVNINNTLPHFPNAIWPDAQNTYLPYAHALLTDKLTFFGDARSLRVAPMSYIYLALFGADPEAIKIGNTVLSCIIVLIMFRLGSLLHSRLAGIAAAFLYAASPILAEFKPVILSEPPFIFFTAIWLMAVAEIVCGRKAFVPLAGIACGLMILTRGTYIYFLYAILVITLFMSWKGSMQQTGRQLFAAHLLALLFPLLFIVKNWIVFGYPGLATGVGTALYFGSHPLTDGYEAPYFSLGYDIGAVTQGLDYLSIKGDSLLKGVAILMLKQQTIPHILAVYFQKTFAFIFTTKAVLPDTVWNLRSLRIFEVILAVPGLLSLRPRLMRWFLGGALVYQIFVHIPMLYNPRYSVGALEIPLILLASIGFTHLLTGWKHQHRPILRLALVFIFIIAAITAGELHRHYSQALMPDILSVPHVKVYQWPKKALATLTGSGVVAQGNGAYRNTEKQWSLDIPIPELALSKNEEYYVYSINMTAQTNRFGQSCGLGAVYFRAVDEPEFIEPRSLHFRIVSNGEPHYYHFSATYGLSPIFPTKAGLLRVAGRCPRDSQIQLDNIVLSASRVAQTYRYLYLNQAK